MVKDQHPRLEWRDNVPVAVQFQDPYFSLGDGLEETRYVFLGGNRLAERFSDGFHIAELGFGTGLNCFAALALWREAGVTGVLRFTTFELFPMGANDMARALAAFPRIAELAAPVLAELARGESRVVTPDLDLTIVTGDARTTVPGWTGQADAWFLDGFAPARNPELWEPNLLQAVADHTAPGGTAATYSAAGAVRRGLEAAGFAVERLPGFGAKRHMTVAQVP